jgi:integrase
MGFARKRVGRNGVVAYAALYRDARGKVRSAGTYPSAKAANKAWQQAEALMTTGRPGDQRAAGRITFTNYVTRTWFPNHVLEPNTRESYRYNLNRHILPWFGPMRMGDIMPIHVREWVSEMTAHGVTPATIRHQKIILSAIFTTALNDYVVFLHPCKGVKTPTVAVHEYRILEPDEVARVLLALPHDPARLLVDTAIGSGMRWGELTELRPRDLHMSSGILTVSRAVMELSPTDHPTGGRFLTKPYPKSTHSRRFRLDTTLVDAIAAHIQQHQLTPDDLLFPFALTGLRTAQQSGTTELRAEPLASIEDIEDLGGLEDHTDLGTTEPNSAGRVYRHGSLSAYTAGACRCAHCRHAFSRYRSQRRANGLDHPRGQRPGPAPDGHLPRNHWRTQIWIPTCTAVALIPTPRMHDLRHSHASWLLAGGADLETVRERLGHGSIVTTGKYVHTLPHADNTALDALNRTRYGRGTA